MTALTPGGAGTPETDALDTKLSEAIWAESRGPGWDDYNEWMGLSRRLERERDALRTSLIRACNATSGGCTNEVSNEFLSCVGAEVEAYIASLKAKEQGQ